MPNHIRPGYHWSQLYDLVDLPSGENLGGATITANLVTHDAATQLIPLRAQSDGAGGANWAQNVVLVEFPAADTGLAAVVTAASTGKNALIQVFVTKGGKTHVYEAGLVPIKGIVTA